MCHNDHLAAAIPIQVCGHWWRKRVSLQSQHPRWLAVMRPLFLECKLAFVLQRQGKEMVVEKSSCSKEEST
jgi:hypothetical protein